uniref:Uncharacterized protein n=1 Tax=Anguilla anguilla TaxID=7936 RepID=A0A0E9XEM8_ANGAN
MEAFVRGTPSEHQTSSSGGFLPQGNVHVHDQHPIHHLSMLIQSNCVFFVLFF